MVKQIKQWVRGAALGAVVLLAACNMGPATFVNTDITGSALVANFKLKDLSGTERTMESYKGKVVAMFFGYTHCPDVCPITMQQWNEVKAKLGAKGDNLQVLFVSIDPERDTPELLKKYVPQFNPSFDALTASSLDELKPLLTGLRVFAGKVEGSSPENYLMDHTSASYVFDQQGRARLLVRHNADSAPVVSDVEQILDGK
ncbi:protein SCO1/2 [Limnobacter thiooxidans]|uniref:SCO family protein n=1 Tax=Limnobacter thiooxidans TaxID=131080 RepID=A0AA86MCC8_9BURK|nr:protein SCO1/2 [Limnobacter thiooxidans]BET24701.1 SCO family protein [Limnobacter thiooxidans]